MIKKLNLLFLLIILISTTCLAQDELINSRLVYSDYFRPFGINYNEAIMHFGDYDAPVACYIAHMTNSSIPSLRDIFINCNRDWFSVIIHFGIDPSVFFIPVPVIYEIGPPYGKAYGYWKKHRANPSIPIVLTSSDIVNLVNLNIIHRHFNTPVIEIMKYKAQNRSFDWIISSELKKSPKGNHPSVKIDYYNKGKTNHPEKHGKGQDFKPKPKKK